jgi:hypothetical protein
MDTTTFPDDDVGVVRDRLKGTFASSISWLLQQGRRMQAHGGGQAQDWADCAEQQSAPCSSMAAAHQLSERCFDASRSQYASPG